MMCVFSVEFSNDYSNFNAVFTDLRGAHEYVESVIKFFSNWENVRCVNGRRWEWVDNSVFCSCEIYARILNDTSMIE